MAIKHITLEKLEEVKLTELKDKPKDYIITKSVKFSSKEYILLQYLQFIEEKFSGYVKELIRKDLENRLQETNISKQNLDLKQLEIFVNNILDNKLKEIGTLQKEKEENNSVVIDDETKQGILNLIKRK